MQDVKKLLFFYLDQLWRRRWLSLAFAWGVCLLGWTTVAFLPDHYTSSARFYVDTMSLLNPLLKGISVNADDGNRDQEVAIMQRTLTSRPNLLKVAQMTDLDKSIQSEGDQQALLNGLEQRISVKSQGNNLFAVEFTDNSPNIARNVVQALLTIFVESSVGNKREDIQTARTFIEAQIEEYEKQLKAAEQKLADFKVKNLEFFSSNAQNFSARMEQAKTTVATLNSEIAETTAQRNQLKAQLDATPQFLAIDAVPQVVVGDGGTPLQQRIKAIQSMLDEMKLQYTSKHPEVVRAEAALKELQEQQRKIEEAPADSPVPESAGGKPRAQVMNDVYNQLSVKLSEYDAKITSAKRRLQDAEVVVADLDKKAGEAPRIEAEFTALNRDYTVMKGNFESLLQRRESARIAQAADSSTEPVQFKVIAAPEVPAEPTGPKRRLFNVMVFIFGIGAGCGFVILMTRIDNYVSSPEDLAEFVGFQVLGCVSTAVILSAPTTFVKRHARFGAATGALAGVFAVFFLFAPNLSTLPQRLVNLLTI